MASTGEVWKLGHRPALDGVRGIAVLLVVATHTDLLPNGGVGVDVFFALSGFLITALLLEEHGRAGSVRLGRFYRRRALRLMPALYVMVAVVTVASVAVTPWRDGPGHILAAVTYTQDFASMRGGSGVFGHTWSLAIEEQFYLVWPLLLMAAGSRRRVMWLAVVLVVASSAWGFAVADNPAHLAFGPDTRVPPLLAGCALSAWMGGRPAGRPRPRLAAAALGVFVGWSLVEGYGPWSAPVAAAAGCLLLWAVASGPSCRPFEGPVLGWLGRRSYGLYLWHFPIAVYVNAAAGDWPPLVRFLVVLPVSVAVAVVSWRWVETPFLRLKDRSVGSVEPAQYEPNQAVVLAGEGLHLGGDLRVRR